MSKARLLCAWSGVALVVAMAITSCGGSSMVSPSSPSIAVSDPSSATSLTYASNVQPILESDCVTCHNSSNRSGGYNLSSYSGVLQAVTAGSAQSLLVRVTQQGGLMYSNFRNTPAEKAATIRRWVVDFNGVQ